MIPAKATRSFTGSTSTQSTLADSQAPANARTRSQSQLDDEFISTVEEIVQRCPQFRILVMGKSGVGKSSLINAAFNVELATVSHEKPGISNIYTEIMSANNPRFVLHDSQGFAAGEVDNFRIVEKFIRERNAMREVKDRLHAIWYCIEVPTEGGSLLEVADLKFLSLDLGKVPIIVVFTKYDSLVSKYEMEIDCEDDDDDITNAAEAAFLSSCIQPLKDATRGVLAHPYVRVSNRPRYKCTLDELVKVTQKHIDDAVWLIWAVAQRVSADVSVDASIRIGKKKYWRGLASSLQFPGKTLKKCLQAIHKDIIMVWNFDDTCRHLTSVEFRALMSNLVDDLADYHVPTKRTIIATVTGAAVIVSGVIPPAAPIAIPIAAGFVFARWVYVVYNKTPGILRCLMAYIVDLTIVMQSLFWLMQSRGGTSPVLRRLIKLAFNAYYESPDRSQVHHDIRAYVKQTNVFNQDRALEEIVRLIGSHRFVPEDIYKVNAQHGPAGDQDEAWDVREEGREPGSHRR